MRYLAFVLASIVAVAASAQQGYSPARYRGGAVPGLAPMAVGGGEVIIELTVSREGRVTEATPIRTTPPFAEMLAAELPSWQFSPAEDTVPARSGGAAARVAVESKVLVAAIYRAPVLRGPSQGEPARSVGAPSGRSPFPHTLTIPPYPPLAISPGVVLIEAKIDSDGRVIETTVLQAAPPFDQVARQELERWTFAPARIPAPGAAFVYVVFGFPAPMGIGPAAPKR